MHKGATNSVLACSDTTLCALEHFGTYNAKEQNIPSPLRKRKAFQNLHGKEKQPAFSIGGANESDLSFLATC